MTEDVTWISSAMAARRKVSENPDDEPIRTPSLLRRARLRVVPQPDPGGWSCPDCGLPTQDPVAARLGFCTRCHEFSGMCGAGRKIVCADVMSMTTWHTPCTNLGASAWQISQDGITHVALLCPQHDAEVKAGTSFLTEAIPLTSTGPYDIGPPPA